VQADVDKLRQFTLCEFIEGFVIEMRISQTLLLVPEQNQLETV
jgi:hypothetical protein